MKKKIVISSFLIAGLFIISSYQNNEAEVKVSTKKINLKRGHAHSHHGHAEHAHRAPASTKKITIDNTTNKAKEVFGHVKKELTESDISIVNKVKNNIPSLKDSEFEIIKRLTITQKSIFVVNSTYNGLPQSFTALIDNKSGRIEKSWGRTRYETPQATRHYPTSTY